MSVVREFHEAFGQDAPDHPCIPSHATMRLRLRLIKEELKEVEHELNLLLNEGGKWRIEHKIECLQRLLKELCDLRYVVEGTAVSFGLPIEEAYAEVHRSNMSKLWPDGTVHKDPGGKILKPPSYSKADMERFVHVVEGTATPSGP